MNHWALTTGYPLKMSAVVALSPRKVYWQNIPRTAACCSDDVAVLEVLIEESLTEVQRPTARWLLLICIPCVVVGFSANIFDVQCLFPRRRPRRRDRFVVLGASFGGTAVVRRWLPRSSCHKCNIFQQKGWQVARMFFWMMVVEEATIVLVCPPIEEVVWWTSWARPRHSSLHDNVEMTAITGGTSAKKGRTNAKKGRTSASAGASGAICSRADKSKI